jgi:hypothetical protein
VWNEELDIVSRKMGEHQHLWTLQYISLGASKRKRKAKVIMPEFTSWIAQM